MSETKIDVDKVYIHFFFSLNSLNVFKKKNRNGVSSSKIDDTSNDAMINFS